MANTDLRRLQEGDVFIKILKKIFNLISKETSYDYKIEDGVIAGPISDQSYINVEKGTPKLYRHKWHSDTGTNSHMSWCKFGTSTLLSNPASFKGAELEYCNCDKPCNEQDGINPCPNNEVITKEAHYLGTGAHDSSHFHRLRCGEESTDGVREGDRITFLAFL